jgi:hypothetical protein
MSHLVTDYLASTNRFLREIESTTLSDSEESALQKLNDCLKDILLSKRTTKLALKRMEVTLNECWKTGDSCG